MFSKSLMWPFLPSLASDRRGRAASCHALPREQVRQSQRERRVVEPRRPVLLLPEDRGPIRGRRVVTERVLHRVHAVRDVGAQLQAAARSHAKSRAPGECKAGAELELANVRLRVKIRDDAETSLHFRNQTKPAPLTRERHRQMAVQRVQRPPKHTRGLAALLRDRAATVGFRIEYM